MRILKSSISPNDPQTALKESRMKSTIYWYFPGQRVPNFRPFCCILNIFKAATHNKAKLTKQLASGACDTLLALEASRSFSSYSVHFLQDDP